MKTKLKNMKLRPYIFLPLFLIIVSIVYIQNYTGHSEVMLNLFSFKTSNDFVIAHPDSDTVVTLNVFNQEDRTVSGEYEIGEERGNVYLDYPLIVFLETLDPELDRYFAAPYCYSNQGSGVFYYIGLFFLDVDKMKVSHIGSTFLGDRIHVQNLDISHKKLNVTLLEYDEDQSFSDQPSVEQIHSFFIDEKKFTRM